MQGSSAGSKLSWGFWNTSVGMTENFGGLGGLLERFCTPPVLAGAHSYGLAEYSRAACSNRVWVAKYLRTF